MRFRLIKLGMISVALAFGMMVIGCDGGTTDNAVPKTLIITNISEIQAAGADKIDVGILPIGTTKEQIQTNEMLFEILVAGADNLRGAFSGSSAPYTATVPLFTTDNKPWTGSGVYDVYFGWTNYYVKHNVSITSANTTVDARTFELAW